MMKKVKSWMGILEQQSNIDYDKAHSVVVQTGNTIYDFAIVEKQDFNMIEKEQVIEAWY